MQNNKPVRVLWDGNIKAAIFANQGQNGPIYSASYARLYNDDSGAIKEAYSFSGAENLRVAELARQVHHVSNELRREFNKQQRTGTAPSQSRTRKPTAAQQSVNSAAPDIQP